MDLFKQLFFYQTSKREQILTKTYFSSQNEPHTAKPCFSVVLKHFGEIHRELLFLVLKETISGKSPEILRKFVFLNKFGKGIS